MFAYIKGEITEKNTTNVVIDVNGVGYFIEISVNTFGKIEQLSNTKLFIYFHVKEDAQTLYGFADLDEKKLFVKLISISGIGPNTARVMLSSLTPKEIVRAILNDNDALIKSVKGIGPKTAKRVILELKDKVDNIVEEGEIISTISDNSSQNQALQALLSLGFSRPLATKALNAVKKEQPNTINIEDLIKSALKKL